MNWWLLSFNLTGAARYEYSTDGLKQQTYQEN